MRYCPLPSPVVVAIRFMQTVLVKRHFGHPYALFTPDYAGDFIDEMSLGRTLRRVFLIQVHHESFVIVRIFPWQDVRFPDDQVFRHDQKPFAPF